MAIVSKEELLDTINRIAGDDTSDDLLKLMEDVSDTYDSFSNAVNEDWKAKYDENDKMWREKYKSRFMESVVKDKVIDGDNPDNYDEDVDSSDVKETFDDLFVKE